LELAKYIDYGLASAWAWIGLVLFLLLIRQHRHLRLIAKRLESSDILLGECRSHLLVTTSNIRELAYLGRAFETLSNEVRAPLGAMASSAWAIQQQGAGDPSSVASFSESVLNETRRLAGLLDTLHESIDTEKMKAQCAVELPPEWARFGIAETDEEELAPEMTPGFDRF